MQKILAQKIDNNKNKSDIHRAFAKQKRKKT